MGGKISLLLPSRQRPEGLKRLYWSAKNNADYPQNTEVVCYIDDDDDSYNNLELPDLKKITGKRDNLSRCWNRCWREAEGEFYGHLGDDVEFQTKGWDSLIRQTFAQFSDKIAFVFGKDLSGVHDGVFGTHGFVHRNWTRVVGYFVPPYFTSDYNDTWLNEVAKKINRHIFVPELIMEHHHYAFGKAEIDKNTEDRLHRQNIERPDIIYNEKQAEREADAAKLLKAIEKRKN